MTVLISSVIAFSGEVNGQERTQEDEIGVNYFPGLGLSILDDNERRQLVSLTDSELCPCPGIPQTLSACLLNQESRCQLAEQVSSLMIRAIKENLDTPSIRDAVVRFITEAQTPREFNLSESPRLGSEDAPVTLVVFSDFECPYCRRFAGVAELLEERHQGSIAIYFKYFPISGHPNALPAAAAASAAHRQGQFWAMHNLIFSNQTRLQMSDNPDDLLLELAQEIGLSIEQFVRDYNDPGLLDIPLSDRDEGRASGVNSTPTCFINGIKFLEDENLENLENHILDLLE